MKAFQSFNKIKIVLNSDWLRVEDDFLKLT